MKHISDAMPASAALALRLPNDEAAAFATWWIALDGQLMREELPRCPLAEAWPLYEAGWGPEAAMHEIADRRAASHAAG